LIGYGLGPSQRPALRGQIHDSASKLNGGINNPIANPTLAPTSEPLPVQRFNLLQTRFCGFNSGALDLDIAAHGQLVNGNARAALPIPHIRQLGPSHQQSDSRHTGLGSEVKNSS
jgi:hypothetical protein